MRCRDKNSKEKRPKIGGRKTIMKMRNRNRLKSNLREVHQLNVQQIHIYWQYQEITLKALF